MTRDDTLATIYNDRNYLVNQLNEAIVAFIYRVYACACVYVTGKFARGQRKRSEIRGWHWKRRVELAVNLRRSRLTRYDRRINEPCNCKRVPVTWNRMKRKAPPDVVTGAAWRAPVKNSRAYGEEIRLALGRFKGREGRGGYFLNANYSVWRHRAGKPNESTRGRRQWRRWQFIARHPLCFLNTVFRPTSFSRWRVSIQLFLRRGRHYF